MPANLMTQAWILLQTVMVLCAIFALALAITHGLMALDRKARGARAHREELRNLDALQASMTTLVWEHPELETNDDGIVVSGLARLFTHDEDGNILEEHDAVSVQTNLPLPIGEQVEELTIVLHHGEADSFSVLHTDGSRVGFQLTH